jgi:hypothetical protein
MDRSGPYSHKTNSPYMVLICVHEFQYRAVTVIDKMKCRSFCASLAQASYYCHVFWAVTIRRGVDWTIGFIDTIHTTRNYRHYSGIADVNTLQFTAAHTSVLNLLHSALVVSWYGF